MRHLWRTLRETAALGALGFALLGLILLLWPGISAVVVCRAVGLALLLYGGIQCIQLLRLSGRTPLGTAALVLNLVITAAGIWVLAEPEAVLSMIPILTGIILLFHGIQDVAGALNLRRDGYPRWWVALVIGIVTALFGVLLFVYPFEAVEVTFRVIGVFLLCDGLSDFWIHFVLSR